MRSGATLPYETIEGLQRHEVRDMRLHTLFGYIDEVSRLYD